MTRLLPFIRRSLEIGGLLLFLASCARQGAPTGGPKDTTPPRVDSTASTPNYATRFQEKKIQLRFDEWVTLSEVATQVVVSPPLRTKRVPDITLKGKTVIVEIPEGDTLRPNTTYTINFGNAVKDLHEGNPAKDLRFVFSTGDFLDSLSVSGIVTDALKLEPVENVAVMLYDELTDSVVLKSKPLYFARTDKSGQFTIPNVRTGRFKAIALDDKDQNLLWNGGDERLAFLSAPLELSDTARTKPLTLRLFQDQPLLRSRDRVSRNYGQIKITYNTTPPDTITLSTDPPGQRLVPERQGDTLLVWYDRTDSVAWRLLAGRDTVPVKSTTRATFMKSHRLIWADDVAAPSAAAAGGRRPARNPAAAPPPVSGGKTIAQHPARVATLPFNFPIEKTDSTRWIVQYDSASVVGFSILPDTANPRRLILRANWAAEKTHRLTLLPGAVTDLYGETNADTLRRTFNVLPEKSLGDLNLTIKDLRTGSRYILQLLNGSNLEEERRFVAVAAEQKILFRQLPAATYTARIVEDWNGNGRWDTGRYLDRRQPEPLFQRTLPALRANWEVEATVQANDSNENGKKQ